MKTGRDFQKDLIHYLKDADAAAGYLNAALEDGDLRIFYIALRDVAEAQGNMTKFAIKCKIPRASLYKITSKKGNPSIETIMKMIQCIGLRLKFENSKHSRLAHV